MAESPAHKFGQIIGDVLEAAITPLLQAFAGQHGLHLDRKGPRPARKGSKVSWIDMYGNKHDLDFVLEKGGTADTIGVPVAFIETAWRRYTKHSRNKAQEIQGAVLPLVAKHENAAPFVGAILAGVFTKGALNQLRSLGFTVLYFPYETVVSAFRQVGIDAWYDDKSPDIEFTRRVREWEALAVSQHNAVARALLDTNSEEAHRFMANLESAVQRRIELVRLLPLHGASFQWQSVEEAIGFVEAYDEKAGCSQPTVKYEVEIRYNNGDRVQAQFSDKTSTVRFLHSFQPPEIRPA